MSLDISHILVGVSIPTTHVGRILHIDRAPLARYILLNGEDLFIESFIGQLNGQWKKQQFKQLSDSIATHDGCFMVSCKGRNCTLCFRGFMEMEDIVHSVYVIEYTCTKLDDICNCCMS